MSLSKNITIAQIAREASVSVATVSRIINKNGYVKPETRQKVIEAMDALGGIAEWYCRRAEVQVLQALFLYAGMRLPHCVLKAGAGDGTQVIML